MGPGLNFQGHPVHSKAIAAILFDTSLLFYFILFDLIDLIVYIAQSKIYIEFLSGTIADTVVLLRPLRARV